MQIKAQTGYSIQILIYLSRQRGFAVGKDISSALGIAETYLPKIIRRLRKAGWLTSTSGITGGYSLAVSPDTITVLDVIKAMEDYGDPAEDLPDFLQNAGASSSASFQALYVEFQKICEQYFSKVTISDMRNADCHPESTSRYITTN